MSIYSAWRTLKAWPEPSGHIWTNPMETEVVSQRTSYRDMREQMYESLSRETGPTNYSVDIPDMRPGSVIYLQGNTMASYSPSPVSPGHLTRLNKLLHFFAIPVAIVSTRSGS